MAEFFRKRVVRVEIEVLDPYNTSGCLLGGACLRPPSQGTGGRDAAKSEGVESLRFDRESGIGVVTEIEESWRDPCEESEKEGFND